MTFQDTIQTSLEKERDQLTIAEILIMMQMVYILWNMKLYWTTYSKFSWLDMVRAL